MVWYGMEEARMVHNRFSLSLPVWLRFHQFVLGINALHTPSLTLRGARPVQIQDFAKCQYKLGKRKQ